MEKIVLIGILSGILYVITSCNLVNRSTSYSEYIKSLNDTTIINYYEKSIVIIWCPKKKEESKYYNSFHKKDVCEIEADDGYYMTMAQSFLLNEKDKGNIKFEMLNDLNDCCGFIVNKDTIRLCKANCVNYHTWCIILFDPSKKPKIVSIVSIEEEFYEYYNIKADK
jgi:hypothetical protein